MVDSSSSSLCGARRRSYLGLTRHEHIYFILKIRIQYDIYAGEVAEWVSFTRMSSSRNAS